MKKIKWYRILNIIIIAYLLLTIFLLSNKYNILLEEANTKIIEANTQIQDLQIKCITELYEIENNYDCFESGTVECSEK